MGFWKSLWRIFGRKFRLDFLVLGVVDLALFWYNGEI